jgi:hypothetical protein
VTASRRHEEVRLMNEREAWLAQDARRRAQYRDSKRRTRAAARERARAGLIGHLHSLGCQRPYLHRGSKRCVPLPVYASRQEAAA